MREDPTKTASLIKKPGSTSVEIAGIRGETGAQKQAEQRTPVDELRQRREDRKRAGHEHIWTDRLTDPED